MTAPPKVDMSASLDILAQSTSAAYARDLERAFGGDFDAWIRRQLADEPVPRPKPKLTLVVDNSIRKDS